MGFLDNVGRGMLDVATFGTPEILNEATGGGVYGQGSNSGVPQNLLPGVFGSNQQPGANLPYYQNPAMPAYQPSYNPSTMGLQGYAQGLAGGIRPNTAGMDAFRKEALRTGPSQWQGLARNQLAGDEARQRGIMRNTAMSNAATARSALATKGGLSGGAAERLAASGNRDLVNANQGLAATALNNRNQLATADESNRLANLRALPGMEIEQLKPAQWAATMQLGARQNDVANQIAETQALNNYNMNAWQTQMQQLQANRNADVMLATAPKNKGLFGNIFGGIFGG